MQAGTPEEAIEEEIFDFDPASVDVSDAINCHLEAPTYNSFAMSIGMNDELQEKLGWKKVENDNPFLLEFKLPSGIFVTEDWTTNRIAFTSTGIVAILDLEDPNEIADEVGVENEVDTDALIASLIGDVKKAVGEEQPEGSGPHVAESIPEPAFRKFLGQTILVDQIGPPIDEENWRFRTIIARNLSNVRSHPGKTLYGCSYKMVLLDSNGEPY
ncbi:MAG: hypothetical protein EDM03_08680 [Porphyrobacter sp. IPPAS B-1204]|nr:MAG: hypothetical protein EDM03_08680 [Porphyrobacter sp. IPPAS B-1204]